MPIATEEITPLGTSSSGRSAIALWILALIALVAALYLARAFIVPLLFGLLISYTLGPVVDWFERYRVPRALGAAFVLGTLVGGVFWMAFSLSGDAAQMIEKLPDAARRLRQNLSIFATGSPRALHHVQEAADELQGVAVDAGLKSQNTPVVVTQNQELYGFAISCWPNPLCWPHSPHKRR